LAVGPPDTGVDPRPVPDQDATTAFFWEGAATGQLLLQRCRQCRRFQYPPDVACTFCQSEDLEVTRVSGSGTVYSFAVVNRPLHPGFRTKLPYIVAIVELDEQPGLRMLTNLLEVVPETVTIGMPVEVTFEGRGTVTLPQFRPLKAR